VYTEFWWGNLTERDHAEDLVFDGGDNKTDLREIGLDGMEWIDLALDREKRQAPMNNVKNFLVP